VVLRCVMKGGDGLCASIRQDSACRVRTDCPSFKQLPQKQLSQAGSQAVLLAVTVIADGTVGVGVGVVAVHHTLS
jgi:hypothetical protein